MGYACPVCEIPQPDAVHLANHVAFSALTGDDDHEAWLDERVPDWGQMGEDDLAPLVAERAEKRDVAVEDATGADGGRGRDRGPAPGHDHARGGEAGRARDHGHARGGEAGRARDHGHARGGEAGRVGGSDHARARGSRPSGGDLDPEAAAILEEARELTREMRDRADDAATEDETE
ncbi:MAG: DUF5810 domain-containing protein [Haloarculaceae archaeon]